MSKKKIEKNISTEEKIKEAARVVFTKKGYFATKTRDIAEEAGMNLALLNYYFRSKEKLFEIIMAEKLQQLFGHIAPVLANKETSLEEKIEHITKDYIDILIKNPDLPLFILNEVRYDPERFSKNIQLEDYILNSHFILQLKERSKDGNPFQYLLTLLGMLVFPFIVRPVFQAANVMKDDAYNQLMEERKSLVVKWMKMIIEEG